MGVGKHQSWRSGKQDSWQYRLMLAISGTTGARNRKSMFFMKYANFYLFFEGGSV